MPEVRENPEAVEHDAGQVVDNYDRSVRNAVGYIAAGLVVYALITGLMALNSWWMNVTRPDHDGSSERRFAFTLDLSAGSAVLGVLTALIIALHVAAWQIKTSGPLANLAHARRKLLSEIAVPVGFLALITGAATLLHDAPDSIGIGPIAIAGAALVIAVFAADIRSALDTNPDIYQQVDDVSRQRDVTTLKNVVHRWRTTRESSTATMLKDLAKATVLTAVPLVVIICATFGARSVGESLRNVGIALLVAAAWVAISLVVVYGGVLHFVTRSHFNFLMCVLIGTCLAISWLVAGLAVWTSDHSTIPRIAATVALLWFAMTPAALITRGLRSDVSARTPGSSARPKLHRALEKRYYRLVPQERDENSAEESTPGRIARIGHWYRLVTGIASEQPSSPQTDSTADDPRVVN